MDFNKLLKRQLNKINLNVDQLPNLEQWKLFLSHINRTYDENDQERYLLERSMLISSKELNSLNEQLETAQTIANLGYWLHDLETGENYWSKHLYVMLSRDPAKMPPNLEEFYDIVHEEDLPKLKPLVHRLFEESIGYEIEIRMKGFKLDNEYRWYHVVARTDSKPGTKTKRIFGIDMDITENKTIGNELALLNEKLISSARRAGMAEVATSILHNVGNILNSANVSLNLLQEINTSHYFNKLFKVREILREHSQDFKKYINTDPKAEMLAAYLNELLLKLEQLHSRSDKEVETLKTYLEHIKNITAQQSTLSGVSSLIEKVSLVDVMESAVKMSGIELENNQDVIEIEKIYEDNFIKTDKNKVLQILVNLIKNAKEALLTSNQKEKKLKLHIKKGKHEFVAICVEDNGIGIVPKDVPKLFTFGFTTKELGHGHGLHSSAINAMELGGRLSVKSNGLNRGAIFTLELPSSDKASAEFNYGKNTKHENFNY